MTIDTTHLPRVLATSGAVGLVAASAGFGALYAYKVGIQHGILLAGLSVLMALALEAVKPLAIYAGLEQLRCQDSRSSSALKTGKGAPLLLLTLGGISVAYSLTAELSLISMSKGDLIAERKSQATNASNAQKDRARVEAELASMGITRPSAAIRADLDGFLADARLKDCASKLESWRLQAICAEKVSPLRSQLALAERREFLEAKLTEARITGAVGTSDPGSTALTAYLTALGFKPDVEKVGLWLLLIPVLALEIGSALAKVLVQAFPDSGVSTTVKSDVRETAAQGMVQAENAGVEPARAKVKTAIVDHLKANGGSVSGGERGLAKLIGSSRGTMKRAINTLVVAGVVAAEASRNGTILRLVG